MATSSNSKSCTFYVEGMHCAACEILVEKKLSKVSGVTSVKADLAAGTVEIKGNFDDSQEDLAKSLTELVEKDGYRIHSNNVERNSKKFNLYDFVYALPIALIFIILFVLLQRAGIVNIISSDETSFFPVLLIGFVASLSSCAAVVGGLALSISTNYSKMGRKIGIASSLSFHGSRIVSFFLLGGFIGWLGSLFTLGDNITNWSIFFKFLTAAILFAVSAKLLVDSDILNRFFPRLPKGLSHKIINSSETNSTTQGGAITVSGLAGILTFFFPCGFTQSIQLQALTTGSFFDGGLMLLSFALGTLPVLALISFASVNLSQSKLASGIFFKVAGFIVLFFGVTNLTGALSLMGLIKP